MYDCTLQNIIDQIQDHQAELWVPSPPPPISVSEDGETEDFEDPNSEDPAPPTPPPPPTAQIISVEVQRHHHIVIEEQLGDLAIIEEQPKIIIQDVPPKLVLPPSPQITVEEEETTTPMPQAVLEIHDTDQEQKEIVEMEVKPQQNSSNHLNEEEQENGGKIQNDNHEEIGPPPQYSSGEEEILEENNLTKETQENYQNQKSTEDQNPAEVYQGSTEGRNGLATEVLENHGAKDEILEESMEFSDENGNNTEPEMNAAEDEPEIPEMIEQTPIILPPMEVCLLETRVDVRLLLLGRLLFT